MRWNLPHSLDESAPPLVTPGLPPHTTTPEQDTPHRVHG